MGVHAPQDTPEWKGGEEFVGREVEAAFFIDEAKTQSQNFRGRVMTRMVDREGRPLYKVVFEDGDEETMHREKLDTMLLPPGKRCPKRKRVPPSAAAVTHPPPPATTA
mmetsp:Transcript_19999/g.63650  ORF Transcript_19999/g.63650 Transcript_19999/m.63650 type:complete len:108 (-) Transcript_19999:134-457(-)